MTTFPKYERYKDSGVEWLGEVPEHREVEKGLRYLFETEDRSVKGDEELLSVSHLTGVTPRSEKNITMFMAESYEGSKLCDVGDIAINTMWAWMSALGVSKYRGLVSPSYGTYRQRKPERFNPTFLDHLIRTDVYRSHYMVNSTGITTSRLRLYPHSFLRLKFICPPHEEQDRIVAFLDQKTAEIDALIAKKQRQIELLDEQKAILINRAVTRGLNPNAKLKPSGIEWIGEIPEHWEVVPLKRNANVQTGLTLGKDYPPSRSVDVPYLRVANVQNGHLALGSVTTLRVPKSLVPRYALQEGDVLVAEGGDLDKLGRGCVWRSEIETCTHQNHVFAVRPYPAKILPEFLSLALSCKYGQRYFMLTGKQTTNLASTNSTALMNFPVALPVVEEQAQILKALDEIKSGFQGLSRLIEFEIKTLKALRSTLIGRANFFL